MDPEIQGAFTNLTKLVEDTSRNLTKMVTDLVTDNSVNLTKMVEDTSANLTKLVTDNSADFAKLVTDNSANLAKLVEDTSQSLQNEMGELRSDMAGLRSDMERGFERVEAATRRNSTSLVAGAAAIAALNRWAGRRDKLDAKRDREIQNLKERLLKVERALKRRERRAS